MGIFSRTRDIFAANMTELLDRAEDPARMIRMIILEMEETLVEVRASAARSIADSKEMKRALVRLEDLQGSWTEKAELALSKDREDLAKAALLERQKAADMADGLKAELATIEDTLKGYEADIAKLQGKLREARARQNAIATRIESAVTRARAREMLNGTRTEDAFSRFEHLERRADFAEGRADALGMTGPKSSASIKFSGSAAQFIVTSGPAQRCDRWWRRSAINSLPVPRSPMTSTGRFNGAARLARSTASRKARLWPTN
jgi:phage shock protein A